MSGASASEARQRVPARIVGRGHRQRLGRPGQPVETAGAEDALAVPRRDRQPVGVVRPDREAALVAAELERALGQRRAVGASEHGQEDLAAPGLPVDVEPGGEAALAPPGQHVEPEAVAGAADPHVVRDDVEDRRQPLGAEGVDHGAEARLAAELGVDRARVGDVVAVGAARDARRRPAPGRRG